MGSTVEVPHAGLMGTSSPKQPASLEIHTLYKLQEVHLGGGIERLRVDRKRVLGAAELTSGAGGRGLRQWRRRLPPPLATHGTHSRRPWLSCRVYTLPPTGTASQMSPVGRSIVYLNPHPLHAML